MAELILEKTKVKKFFEDFYTKANNRKRATIKRMMGGVEFTLVKDEYSIDFYIGGDLDPNNWSKILYPSNIFWYEFDKDIWPELVSTWENRVLDIEKKYYPVYIIEKTVKQFLTNNKIPFSAIHAINTSSVYVKTPNGKIRISDHSGSSERDVDIFHNFYDGKYFDGEIENRLLELFFKKPARVGFLETSPILLKNYLIK
jgi:hypothetical protein